MRNVGQVDRIVRGILALALLGLGVLRGEWPIVLIGVAIGATAVLARCPLYRVYGLCTIGGVQRNCDDGSCANPQIR